MHTVNAKSERLERFSFFWLPLITALALLLALTVRARLAPAQGTTQPAYASAEQASEALYKAVQKRDEQAILQILGGQKELISSGDEQEDKFERKRFAEKYQEMHRLVRQADGSKVLYIGAENWPFPTPLISKNGKWRFDAEAGMQEILFRRIGKNETITIQICHALVRAITEDTSATDSNDPLTQYVQTLASAQAADANDAPANGQGASAPFNGYYFRRVSKEPGIADGNVVFVAYPAEYHSSGVMTFVVTSANVVFEKDLGPDTARLAQGLGKDTPDSSWQLAQ
jgi:hypothetical protein